MSRIVDALLHSDAPLVVVEAAAGCGKTWTAAKFAREMSDRLTGGRVLLLSHTHAACGEFHRRCEGPGLRVDVETCDSFALKVLSPYVGALGLPHPLDRAIGRTGGVSFATLGAKALELVKNAPSVARAIAARFPIVILDEHQDATFAQHEVVMTLMRAGGARLRIFGDPMQALHPPGGDEFVDWGQLWRGCSGRLELTEPRRWPDAPELGNWITTARKTLQAGEPLVIADASAQVTVISHAGLAGRNRFRDPQAAGALLRNFLDEGPGRAVVIAHLSEMVRSLAQAANWRVSVNEGAVLEHLDRLLDETETERPRATDLALAFLHFAHEISSGFGKQLRVGLSRRAGLTLDRQRSGAAQAPWLEALEAVYAVPTHRGLADAMARLADARLGDYRIRLRDHASTLRALGRTDDPRGHLQALSRIRRRRALPNFSASTVHKAKGLEFRRVMVCPADAQQFPGGLYGARLLYVALSRATHRLTLVTDPAVPSPHLDVRSRMHRRASQTGSTGQKLAMPPSHRAETT